MEAQVFIQTAILRTAELYYSTEYSEENSFVVYYLGTVKIPS